MLGDFGETLVVDWGMAKVARRGDVGSLQEDPEFLVIQQDANETVEGSIFGTPTYMSPEQARGEIATLGPPCDIYGLGAMLYCLLTGLPPYHKGTSLEVLQQVRRGKMAPPIARNSRVPQPLDAISRKAMKSLPADRYGTAVDLAEDVTRWLNDDTVSAWREPLTIRTRRWMRRHQTLVTSTAATVLMAVLTLSVLTAVVTGKNRELATLNVKERSARLLAQENEALLSREKHRLELSLESGFKLLRGIESERYGTLDDAYSDILQTGLKLPDTERAAMRPLYLALVELQTAIDQKDQVPAGMIVAAQHLRRALELLDESLEITDQVGLTWLLRAQIRQEHLGIPAIDVLADWNRAVALLPRCSAVHSGRGFCWVALEDHEAAKRDWQRAVELDAGNEFAHLGLARLAERGSDLDTAITEFQIAADLPPRFNSDPVWRLAVNIELSVAYWTRSQRRLKADNVRGSYDDMLRAAQFSQPKDILPIWKNLIIIAQILEGEDAATALTATRAARSRFRSRDEFDFARDVIVSLLESQTEIANPHGWDTLRQRRAARPAIATELNPEFFDSLRIWSQGERLKAPVREAVRGFLELPQD